MMITDQFGASSAEALVKKRVTRKDKGMSICCQVLFVYVYICTCNTEFKKHELPVLTNPDTSE